MGQDPAEQPDQSAGQPPDAAADRHEQGEHEHRDEHDADRGPALRWLEAHELVDLRLPARAQDQHDHAEDGPEDGEHLPGAAPEAGRQPALGQLRHEPGDHGSHAVADGRGDPGDDPLQQPSARQQRRRQRRAAEDQGAERPAPGVPRQPPPPPAGGPVSPVRRRRGRRGRGVRGGSRGGFDRHPCSARRRPTLERTRGHRTPTGRVNRDHGAGSTIRAWDLPDDGRDGGPPAGRQ
jgi:hypothetical protein